MTEPTEPPLEPELVEGRETEDLRPVPAGKPGVYWGAMRIALAIVVVGIIAAVIWVAVSSS
jgi:hypothetical protein